MKYVILFIIGLTILFSRNAVSQDYNFSQFDQAPLILNPALTGSFIGSHRINLNYRNQWASVLQDDSYTSTSLAYDTQYLPTKSNIIGLGVHGAMDAAGELSFRTDEAGVLLSYHKRLDQDSEVYHLLGVGLNFAYVQRNINLLDARWPSQHDGNGGFDPTVPSPSQELIIYERHYFDFGLGLLWQSILTERTSLQFGLALHHVNKPNITFIEPNGVQLYVRSTIHGSAEIELSKYISILPSFMYQTQGPHKESMMGTSGKWFFNKHTESLQLGFWIRIGRNQNLETKVAAYVFSVLYDFGNLQLGLSYDNFDALGSESYEISMGYIFDKKNNLE